MPVAKYLDWLLAESREERLFFWKRFSPLLMLITALAHLPFIGWISHPSIPLVSAWELNPVIWLPYFLAGQSVVAHGFLPPLAHLGLYILTIAYWILLAFAPIKFFTMKNFGHGREQGQVPAGTKGNNDVGIRASLISKNEKEY